MWYGCPCGLRFGLKMQDTGADADRSSVRRCKCQAQERRVMVGQSKSVAVLHDERHDALFVCFAVLLC